RTPRPARTSAGGVLGVAVGFFVGCWWLGLWPHWPPREDQDRLLLILFPALIGVELVGAFRGQFRWLVWLLRLVIAAGTAPVLLYHTSYLTDLAGPGTREWTPAQTGMILGSLAAALAGGLAALALLGRPTSPHPVLPLTEGEDRVRGRSIPLAVAFACAGAAVTVMLSGYASGGQMGLPLAAALVGAMVASLALVGPLDVNGILGPGVVGLFALLVI